MFYILSSIVLGSRLSVCNLTAYFSINPINFLKIAGILLADLSITAHDVGYEEFLTLLVEIRIQQLYLIVIVDKEILLKVLQLIIFIFVTYIQLLDLDVRIDTFMENVLVIKLFSIHGFGPWIEVYMDMRRNVDQYENDLVGVIVICHDMVETLNLLRLQ